MKVNLSKLCNGTIWWHRNRYLRALASLPLRKMTILVLTCLLFVTYKSRRTRVTVPNSVEEDDVAWEGSIPFIKDAKAELMPKATPALKVRPTFGPIECHSGNKSFNCLRWGEDIFLPFTFIHDEFEIYGAYERKNGVRYFAVEHSTGRIHPPLEKYHALGIHLDDLYAFVEGRPWVIFVDGKQGVPLCRQWFPDGFFFSTNIAQFGLAHYSQHVVEPPPQVIFLEKSGSSLSKWVKTDKAATLEMVQQLKKAKEITALSFKTKLVGSTAGIYLPISNATSEEAKKLRMFYLSVDVNLTPGSYFMVHLQRVGDGQNYTLRYVANDTSLYVKRNNIVIGLGARAEWSRVTRNLYLDLEQAVFTREGETKGRVHVSFNYIKAIHSVELQGEGLIHNMTLSSSEHLVHFQDAADWVMKNQDEQGGWPMPVERELGTDVLKPGWYTALGQGVCISLLARAYGVTKDERYLDAAIKGTRLFNIPSSEGGVKAVFMDKYVWYEEYPTQPSSFVLNGFIIALFGLYDLQEVAPSPKNEEPKRLYDEGMTSLKALLPLYDIGTRTVYDLRHYTMHTLPNVCRWDYHNLHTLLLNHLETIDDDPVFKEVGERWMSYKNGYRTPMDTNQTLLRDFNPDKLTII